MGVDVAKQRLRRTHGGRLDTENGAAPCRPDTAPRRSDATPRRRAPPGCQDSFLTSRKRQRENTASTTTIIKARTYGGQKSPTSRAMMGMKMESTR